jgi:hypothetical protein
MSSAAGELVLQVNTQNHSHYSTNAEQGGIPQFFETKKGINHDKNIGGFQGKKLRTKFQGLG